MNDEKEAGGVLDEVPLEEEARPRLVGRVITMLLPFVALTLVIVPFSIASPEFRTLNTFKTVVLQTVIVAIAAMGMTFVIISAGIDLSVGSIIALTTVVTALVLKYKTGWPPILAVFAGLGMAALCGFLNGAMITVLRIVPFIATLGMLGIARGVAKWFSGETVVYPYRDTWINDLMARMPKAEWLAWEPHWFKAIPDATRQPLEQIIFSPGIWILLAVVIVMWLVLKYTTFGRYTIAIGSNEATARLCGVRVNWVLIWIYTLAGLLAGLGGILQYSRLTGGDPTVAIGLELDVIAAVVIGGGSLSGGKGSILGTLIGALAMSFLRMGCDHLEWKNYVQEIFIGIFIVMFVAIDQLRQARKVS